MLEIKRISVKGLVSLKTTKLFSKQAAALLPLAEPLQRTSGDWQSLWLGPDGWLMMSDLYDSDALTKIISSAFGAETYVVADMSSAYEVISIRGGGVRELLSSGCGLDFRPDHLAANACLQTRFAQIAVVISAREGDSFEVMYDYSFSDYMSAWINDSAELVCRANSL